MLESAVGAEVAPGTGKPRGRRRTDTKPTTVIATATAIPISSPASREAIAVRAYELFLARGAEHGNDVGDWINAERELTAGVTEPGVLVQDRADKDAN